MLVFILAACSETPPAAPGSPIWDSGLIDTWIGSWDDLLPYLSAPICGYLYSDGDAYISDEDEEYNGHWTYDDVSEMFTIKWHGVHIADFSVEYDAAIDVWWASYSGHHHQGTIAVTEGCD